MAPSHYLKSWLLISDAQWHSPESNFTAIVLEAIILYNDIEDYTSVPEKPSIRHLSNMYAIQICEIFHQTYGPSHWKCPMIFMNTVILWKLLPHLTGAYEVFTYSSSATHFNVILTKIHNYTFMKNQDAFHNIACKMSAILSSPNELNFTITGPFRGSTLSQCLFYKQLSVIPSTAAQW